jgi:hypothetical protein
MELVVELCRVIKSMHLVQKENIMKSFKLLVVLFLIFFTFNSFATEGKWIQGYEQGNYEYFTDKGTARLYIGCPTKEGSATRPSSVQLEVNGKDINTFKLEVGGNTFDGPFKTGSRVNDNNFTTLIDNLRQTDVKVTFGKTVIVFPKSNAAKVVPTFMSGKLQCNI